MTRKEEELTNQVMDAHGSVEPPAAKKCKHCGHTDHLRRTSARCQYNNSKMLAAPRVELVHETTGNTDFADESNTHGSSGSSWLA